MTEELDLVVSPGPHPVHVRVRAGLKKSKNWRELAKFCIVGGSGYVVNLCVFAFVFEVLDVHHLIAATAAFVVVVSVVLHGVAATPVMRLLDRYNERSRTPEERHAQ